LLVEGDPSPGGSERPTPDAARRDPDVSPGVFVRDADADEDVRNAGNPVDSGSVRL
jgi:hypothetical protein